MPLLKLPEKMEKNKFDLFLSEPRITPVSEIKHYNDDSTTNSSKLGKNITLTTELVENIENVRIYVKIVKSFPNVKNELSILSTLTEIQEFIHVTSKLISSFSSASPGVILINYLSKPFDKLCDIIYAILQILNKHKSKKVTTLYKVVYNKNTFENYLSDLMLFGKFCNFAKYLLYKQNKFLNKENSHKALIEGDNLSNKFIPLLNKQELLNKTHNVISSDKHQEIGTTIILQTKEDIYKEKKELFNNIEDLKKNVINCYRKLINNGDPAGYRKIGNFIYKHSTDKTTDIAKYWLFLASENFEDDYVYYNLGRIYEKEGSSGNKELFTISIAYFRKAAHLGLTKSYNKLGQIYEFNLKDENKAKEYYKEGIEKRDIFCMNNLARLNLSQINTNSSSTKNSELNKYNTINERNKELLERHETRRDFYSYEETVSDCKKHKKFEFSIPPKFDNNTTITIKHSLALFKRACSLKNEHSLINLGIIYEDGEFVTKDLLLAESLFLEAEKVIKIKIKQKHKEIKLLETIHYLLGKINYKLGDFESAFLRFSKVKKRGKYGHFGSNTDIYLGLLFELGQFVQINRNRARTHYLWACGKANSNLKALFKLGELNYNDSFEGLKQKGKEQLIECADKNITEAIIKVASIFEIEGDYERAKEYYSRINNESVLNVENKIKRLISCGAKGVDKIEGTNEIRKNSWAKKEYITEVENIINEKESAGFEENEKAIKRLFHGDKNDGLRISNDILSYFIEDHM